jgi:hypothetical protein
VVIYSCLQNLKVKSNPHHATSTCRLTTTSLPHPLYHPESGIYYQQPTKTRDSVKRKSRLTGTVIIYLVLQQAVARFCSFKHCIASFPYRVLHPPRRRRTAFDCVPLSFARQSTSWHSFLQNSGPRCRDRCCEVRGADSSPSRAVYKALRHAADSADTP